MAGYYWKNWSSGCGAPSGAVQGGRDIDGTVIYVGRGHHQGDLLPAKVMPNKRVAYVSWNGKEIKLLSCEILCQQTFSWVHASNGHVPNGAVPIGRTSRGETLYAARVNHKGSVCVGKLHPSHGSCYIPFGSEEKAYSYYEVLVLTD